MSIFKKIIKGVGNVASDIFKATVVEPVASSVNSVLNKEKIDVKYSTKFGKSVGGISEVSTDTLHGALKKVGNAFTGGYADKAADLIRTDDAKSSLIGISEFGGQKPVFEKGALKTAGNAIQVVGSVVGDIVGAAAADKASKMSKPNNANANMVGVTNKSNMSFLSNALTGVQNFAKSPIGQAAGNMLGSVLSNITAPKKSNAVAQAAQQVVLQQATNTIEPLGRGPLSPVSAAALGTSLTATEINEIIKQAGGGSKTSSVPVWLWPVVGGVAFLITVVVLIFSLGKRR